MIIAFIHTHYELNTHTILSILVNLPVSIDRLFEYDLNLESNI